MPYSINLGNRSDDPTQTVSFPEGALHEHIMIYGGIGRGKSKLLEHMLRQLLFLDRPFCLIDPHGDLAEDLLAHIYHFPEKVSPRLRKNLCYLEPAHPQWCFSFDPFSFTGDPKDLKEWFQSRIKHVTETVIRGETTSAPRLRRVLPLLLSAIATPLDDKGTHLSLADALVLLNPGSPEFEAVYPLIAPRLAALDRDKSLGLRQLLDDHRRFHEVTESTSNRLHGFLFQRVKDILSAPTSSLDFREIVRNGKVLIVNLRTSDERFAREHADAFGELLIRELLTAVQNVDRKDRRRYFLFVDEASRFVSNDLAQAFREARKWLLSLCLATQDVSSLKSDDQAGSQSLERAAGLANMKITFRQDDPDDIEHVGKMFAYKRIDRSRKIIEIDRQDGWESKTTRSHSTSKSDQSGWHSGKSAMEQQAMPTTPGGSISRREGTASTGGQSGTQGHTASESVNEVLVPKYKVELRDEGMKHPLPDQIAHGIADVSELPKQHAIVQFSEKPPIAFTVAEVLDANRYCQEGQREKIIESFKDEVCSNHPSSFRRSDVVIDDHLRLSRLIEAAKRAGKNQGDEPSQSEPRKPTKLDGSTREDNPFDF